MTKTAGVGPSETSSGFALSPVETCLRNTELEDLHAGICPRSLSGDASDVKVATRSARFPAQKSVG
jgi:hypothetical protein